MPAGRYWRRPGCRLTDLRSRGLGSVVATLTIDFHHEVLAGQLVLVTGALTQVGRKSFSYELPAARDRLDDPLRHAEDGGGVLRYEPPRGGAAARRHSGEARRGLGVLRSWGLEVLRS